MLADLGTFGHPMLLIGYLYIGYNQHIVADPDHIFYSNGVASYDDSIASAIKLGIGESGLKEAEVLGYTSGRQTTEQRHPID